jgi:hypothetical protein
MTDPATRRVVGLCTGPDPDGTCPRAAEPPFDCVGLRLIPSGQGDADGLPFTVTGAADGRCPLAWIVQQSADDAAPDPANDRDLI